jgi:hypothetical protein
MSLDPSRRSDAWAEVGPPDCAFAVGVPLTREDFDHDLAYPHQADYVPGLMRSYSGVDKDFVWERHYAPVAQALQQHCDDLEALGVTVSRATCYEAFRSLLAPGRFKVVTLFTHSRWSEVTAADIPNVRAFVEAVRAGIEAGSPFLTELGRLLEETTPGVTGLSQPFVNGRSVEPGVTRVPLWAILLRHKGLRCVRVAQTAPGR